jgi:hypothetical protein
MEYLAHWVFENWVIEVVLITNRRTSVVPICRHKVTVKCISKITIIFIQTTFLLRNFVIKRKKRKKKWQCEREYKHYYNLWKGKKISQC